MAAGIAVVAVSSVLARLSQSFVQLLVLRGVGGLGSAMFTRRRPDPAAGQRARAGSAAGPAACSAAGSCSAASAARRSAGWSPRGRCGRRSSSTAGCCSVPAVIAAFGAAQLGRPGAPRARQHPAACRAGAGAAQPRLPGRGVGQPGRRLRRGGRAQRHRAAVRPGRPAPVRRLDRHRLPAFAVLNAAMLLARRAGGRCARPTAGHHRGLHGVSRRHADARVPARPVGVPGCARRAPASVPGCSTSRRRR